MTVKEIKNVGESIMKLYTKRNQKYKLVLKE